MSNKIGATVLLDSVCSERITTFILTAPRFILAEINTHGMTARNSASSRAIPTIKRIQQVMTGEGFTPSYLGRNQPGMSADNPLSSADSATALQLWQDAGQSACHYATQLDACGAHKQLANRLLEPYSYCTTLLTATELGNLFNLRIHPAAQPEFCELAGCMLEAYVASTPQRLEHGDWHIPFGDRLPEGTSTSDRLLVSAARCARISYDTHGGSNSDPDAQYRADIALANRLLADGHVSPFQHQAQAVDGDTWHEEHIDDIANGLIADRAHWDGVDVWWGQFRWWRQYRKTLPGENRREFDPDGLLSILHGIRAARYE